MSYLPACKISVARFARRERVRGSMRVSPSISSAAINAASARPNMGRPVLAASGARIAAPTLGSASEASKNRRTSIDARGTISPISHLWTMVLFATAKRSASCCCVLPRATLSAFIASPSGVVFLFIYGLTGGYTWAYSWSRTPIYAPVYFVKNLNTSYLRVEVGCAY